MSALPIIESLLSAAPAVTGIVSDRVYYSVAPQGAALPYIVMVGTAETDEVLLQGQAQFPEGLVSVAMYGADFPTIESLGDAVISALADASGLYRGHEAKVQRDGGGSFDFLPADRTHRRIESFSVRYR
ncbi:DUF3168 domain-containing protein [Mesorhizobium sp. LHD-90]|uniref:tail completion protein gp17 n=1 Tax=Mesorhizobium sp. LHD-90 TaxID=3071414 RepID=UPI0027E159F8|nr:DUF3168 domain-containing protein [Mesorhizobium sp. LHD-90]MDQ6434391.1 DUF3168 domain-containing protein [Mesorhizobium sp. LHD-90]